VVEVKCSKVHQDATVYRKQKFDPALLQLLDASEEALHVAEVGKAAHNCFDLRNKVSVQTLPCSTPVKT